MDHRFLVSRTASAASAASEDEYWAGVMEEDTVDSFANLANWQGFLPPPPRPSFLDELASSDSLTTCEMCSWAYQDGASSMQVTQAETAAELGWVMTLAVVSLLSAAIGAAVMVTVLHCRSRLSGFGSAGLCTLCVSRSHAGRVSAPTSPLAALAGGGGGEDKEVPVSGTPHPQDVSGPLLALWRGRGRSGATQWPWRRREAGAGKDTACKGPAPENHYTLEELAYSGGASDEALYAELDRPSVPRYQYQNATPLSPPCHCGQGALQVPVVADSPSAPSSAYYSDLSAPDLRDRTYEAVGVGMPVAMQAMPCLSLQVNPHWEAAAAAAEAARRRQLAHQHLQRQFQQLQHIQMTPQQQQQLQQLQQDSAVPSDYV